LLNPKRLLFAAALFHLLLTVSVFTLGRNAILPSTFDTNGTAVAFASDGVAHREDAAALSQHLRSAEFGLWFSSAYPFHVKLYSISFAVFGSILGFNILGAEPVNLVCYFGILVLVWKLADGAFDPPAGILAAGAVALWPSFVLHSTQLLKDPLFILGMLALVFTIERLLTVTYSWRKALLLGLAAAAIAAGLWKIRSDMGPLLLATVILGAVALALRQFQLRRIEVPNLCAIALVVMLTAATMLWLPAYRDADNPRQHERVRSEARIRENLQPQPTTRWWEVGAHIGVLRQRFVTMYPESSSNIDAGVKMSSNVDLIRYLPRAITIGLFAPFPNMWFETGTSVGAFGRMLSGLETLLMYSIEALALVGLWRGRRRLAVWLLFSIAAMGTIALGLVVLNIGTLYRLRYVFLILLVVIAAGGFAQILEWSVKKRNPIKQASA
jgi:hypothetical protein